ncbi:MAG: hypothetical protein LAT81_15050 [Oceanicaulis sp.]|nr:hypothetical protein [Oceanicaulis sp.]
MIYENNGVGICVGEEAFTYSVKGFESRDDVEQLRRDRLLHKNWEQETFQVGRFHVIPFGPDNRLDRTIRDTIGRHNLAPRVFTKRKFLTWGMGPALYRRKIEGNKLLHEWVSDPEVEEWMQSWDAERYLQGQIEDFNHLESTYTKVINAKGGRIGSGKINRLEHVSFKNARLAKEKPLDKKPKYVLEGDWDHLTTDEYTPYHLFDPADPFKHGRSIAFNSLYSFGMDFYSSPDIVGSLPWIRRSVAIPHILEAFSENTLHIKWHIISPAKYWEEKEEQLKQECTRKNKNYNAKMLSDLKQDVLTKLSQVLSGEVNVGKFWHSEKVTEIIGNTSVDHKWELIPLDQKIKEYVETQLMIAEKGNFQTIAGLGLHQSLANIAANGKSDSGSEQLYAMKNYLLTETALPEYVICKAINDAIRINWPNKKLKIGFYRALPEREEDVSSKDRLTNADTV